MSLRTSFAKLKAHKYAWVVYSTLIIILSVLLIFTGECFVVLLIPLLMFGMPYLFGVRKIRRFLLVGTLCIVVVAICIGTMFTYLLYTDFGVQSGIEPRYGTAYTKDSKWGVTPTVGSTQTAYKYSITLKGAQNATYSVAAYISSYATVLVNLNTLYTNFEKTGKQDAKDKFTNFLTASQENGTLFILELPGEYQGNNVWLYEREIKLNESFYPYFYFVVVGKWFDGKVEHTPLSRGPFVNNMDKYLFGGYMIGLFMLHYFILFGIVFFIIVMLYWWLQKGRRERERLEKELQELERREKIAKGKKVVVEYLCSKCNAVVTEKDVRCPKCGELFEEEEPKEKLHRKTTPKQSKW